MDDDDDDGADAMFRTVAGKTCAKLEPRLGKLTLPGRKPIDTPHYLGITSRGAVPHISQDTFTRDTNIAGVYAGLEDCECNAGACVRMADGTRELTELKVIERAPRKTPPVYGFSGPDGASPLRRFTALDDDALLVLGARRTPPVAAPAANPNTDQSVAISTSVGFRHLDPLDYAKEGEKLRPDVIVGLGDIPYGRALGSKRVEKAIDRNLAWLQDHIAVRSEQTLTLKTPHPALFASLLPVSCAHQKVFVDYLEEDGARNISGLAFYDVVSIEDLPDTLTELPRIAFTAPSTPNEILRQVSLGFDILTIPFVGAATDAGIALDFSFSTQATSEKDDIEPRALGIDMWSEDHCVDLSPLSTGCTCYACKDHHRAYIQHLLSAKEMLGWVLLQIHNYHTMDQFFAAVRQSIAQGTFVEDVTAFAKRYESQLPEKTGLGPRVRGYQFKSEGPGEPKKNKPPFNMLDDGREKLAEAIEPQLHMEP